MQTTLMKRWLPKEAKWLRKESPQTREPPQPLAPARAGREQADASLLLRGLGVNRKEMLDIRIKHAWIIFSIFSKKKKTEREEHLSFNKRAMQLNMGFY